MESNQFLGLENFIDSDGVSQEDSEEYGRNAAIYGSDAADAKWDADMGIDALHGKDELLVDIIRRAYSQLGRSGLSDLDKNGFQSEKYLDPKALESTKPH